MEAAITEELIARQPPEAQAIIRLLLVKIAALERENGELKTRLEELERQAKGKTPQNSSLPPSTQHPHARPQPPRHKSKKKRGGQPGHEKHERPLIPTEECDDVQRVAGRPNVGAAGRSFRAATPSRFGIKCGNCPRSSRIITEYQRHRLTCPGCGATTCAELPVGIPQGQSGPRLMALTTLLMAFYRQSKRRTADFLTALLGQPCCPALTVKIQNQVTAALRPSYEEVAAALPAQEHLNIDETATKEENGKAWLWTFVARLFTVFAVRATREATALGVFLGETFHGIVTCDRAKMYWQVERLQWCWAHLKRDFQAMIDTGNPRSKWLGERLRHAACELFEHWADYRAGRITRVALVRRMGPVRRKVERLLLGGMQSGNKDVRGTCRELYEHRGWLWTFLHHEGVEPTNNAGERSLRHAVIWRKLSFGTQSAGR